MFNFHCLYWTRPFEKNVLNIRWNLHFSQTINHKTNNYKKQGIWHLKLGNFRDATGTSWGGREGGRGGGMFSAIPGTDCFDG